jgi:phospholipid-translocating P-type ATPase (flippase)
MEHPNKLIDTFSGVIDLLNIGRYAIEPQNVLLRGCVLRNTEWVVGIVVNTGHDTKIMMSATETTVKYSKLESEAAYQIKRIIVLLIALCLVGTIGHLIWDSVYQINHIWYLRWKPNAGYEFIVMFFYFLLLHATFIPVSLYVSMSIARYCQRFFMNNDLEMYYSVTDTPASVRTMTLNEELGQITHVFTDKTGTLTRNVMDFRKASINGVKYGLGITEIGKSAWKLQGKDVPQETQEGEERAQANAVPHVSFYCPDYEADMRKGGPQAENIDEFFRILSICHDVIPENLDGKMVFSASNPDDQALVCAAEYFGFAFRDRKDGSVIILEKKANKQSCFEILDTLEFSSQRKRMSVIVQNGDSIALYCKGADSVVLPRLSAGQETLIQKTESDLRQFEAEGLRVLIVAKKVMSKDQYIQWKTQYKAAKTDMIEIEKRKKRQKNMIDKLESSIEKDLILLGATAIEDRLQFGVPQCISNLMEAKVNVWVLTGDKEETAINVAIACNVLQPENFTEHIIINRSRCPTANDVSKLFDLEIQVCVSMLHLSNNSF